MINTSENQYIKEYVTQRLNPYVGNKMVQIIDAEIKVNEIIKNIAKEREMKFACIFREFNNDEITTLDELDYSYFLTNDISFLVPKSEDSEKAKSFLVCS